MRSTQVRTDQCVLPLLGIRGHEHREDVQKHRDPLQQQKHIRIIAGGFNAQLGLGIDSERDNVGEHTMGQSNNRGIWMKQWLMIQNYVALNTTCKTQQNNNTQLGCVEIDKRDSRYFTDAEANDMIHLESGHRSVTAQVQDTRETLHQ